MAQVDLVGGTQDYPSDFPTPPGATTQPAAPSAASSSPWASFYGQKPGIAAAYQRELGRSINENVPGLQEGEYQYWLGNPNYEEGIRNSAEAQDYRRRMAGGSGGSGGSPAPTAAPSGGPSYSGTNIFTDPASSQWEALVNQRIKALNQPYQNPDLGPLQDYLRQYFGQLQQPGYSQADQAQINTALRDPLAQQRDAARQQTIQRLAARGISPTSGVAISALNDLDRQFDRMVAQGENQLATQSIARTDQRQAQAGQIGQTLAAINQAQFNAEEARRQQAVELAKVIPDTSWQRLLQGSSLIQQTNPASALQLLQGFQQQGYNQQANNASMWSYLIPTLLSLFNQ